MPTLMTTGPVFPRLPQPPGSGLREHGFAIAWMLALSVLILNFGEVLGLGNINAFEKLLFLAAAACYLHGKALDPVAAAGLGLVSAAVLAAGLLTPFPAYSWGRALFALIALLSLAAFYLAPPSDAQRGLVLRSVAWIPVALLAYGMLLAAVFGKPLYMRDHTGAMRLGGATIPAFMAAASYAGSVAASFQYGCTRRFRYLLLAVLALAICAMSGTRMPTACATASVVQILLLSMRSAGARLALIACGSMLSCAFLMTAGSQIVIRILSGSSSGREKIWGALLPWVERYPFTGVGFGHHGMLIPDHVTRLTNTTAAHNEYLRLLVELGYAGETAFLAGMALLFLGAVGRRPPLQFFSALMLLAVFFLYAATDNVFYLSYALITPLCIALGMPRLEAGREKP
ncbi:MAG TPA: O-antigen ligase family protein [Noviherbaspirillum sp.]|jgi:hypothetical protein|uniref:O-antigen ligase family protein n=1 Tax=Noviherbaspirillum sp. TaxID=1926288 RepID=UPI002F95BC6A